MVVVMVASGVGHFVATDVYVAMVPALLPAPKLLVWVSGVAELAGGLGLVAPWPRVRRAAALGLIALLVAVFPANVNMAVHHLSPAGLHASATALWLRLPFQAVLIAWAWWLSRRPRAAADAAASRLAAERTASATGAGEQRLGHEHAHHGAAVEREARLGLGLALDLAVELERGLGIDADAEMDGFGIIGWLAAHVGQATTTFAAVQQQSRR